MTALDVPQLDQAMLIDLPVVGIYPATMTRANELLTRWAHKLGPVNRPMCRQEGWEMRVDGEPVSVAVSAPIVSATVQGFDRTDVLELARLCAQPGNTWANRVMLRIWRESLALKYQCWTPVAAVSYSVNTMHKGNLYRHDGWRLVTESAGSNGGGTWSAVKQPGDPGYGKKTLWMWDYRTEEAR